MLRIRGLHKNSVGCQYILIFCQIAIVTKASIIVIITFLFIVHQFRVAKFLLRQAVEPSDGMSHKKAPGKGEKRSPRAQVLTQVKSFSIFWLRTLFLCGSC